MKESQIGEGPPQAKMPCCAVAVIDSRGLSMYHSVFAAISLPIKLFDGIATQQFTLGEKQPGEFETWQKIGSKC